MSISSIAEDSALRLMTPQKLAPNLAEIAATAATTAAEAAAGGASAEDATERGKTAASKAQDAQQDSPAATTPAGPLSQLVKYIPTETISLYIAIQAALGDVSVPEGGKLSRRKLHEPLDLDVGTARNHDRLNSRIELPEPEECEQRCRVLVSRLRRPRRRSRLPGLGTLTTEHPSA